MSNVRSYFFALTALLFTSTSHAGWFGKDPELKRNYTHDELVALETQKQSALRKEDGFIIEDGYVFYLDTQGKAQYVSQSSKVVQIILFKQKLIALRSTGTIFILTEDKKLGAGGWFEIGNSTVSISTDDSDLYAETKKEGVWVYKGQPGEVVWTYITTLIPIPCGKSVCLIPMITPTIAGRAIAFKPLSQP